MTNALLCEIAFVAGIRRTDWTVIPGIEMKLEIEPNDCSFFGYLTALLFHWHSQYLLYTVTETDSYIISDLLHSCLSRVVNPES